jgi:hypothetical protein
VPLPIAEPKMSDHEAWGSRMQRGTFNPCDWARDLKRDIALYEQADAAVRKEVEENEGDDPMSDEYKSLDMARSHAASNISRHLNHDVLIAVADLILDEI